MAPNIMKYSYMEEKNNTASRFKIYIYNTIINLRPKEKLLKEADDD